MKLVAHASPLALEGELLDRVATRIATLEPGAVGATLWVHPGHFATYAQAREDRNARLEELRRRWDEEHAKLKALVGWDDFAALVKESPLPAYAIGGLTRADLAEAKRRGAHGVALRSAAFG